MQLKINYDGAEPTISARALHRDLGVSQRFSVWFVTNSRDFIENQDYFGVYTQVQGNQYGGFQSLLDFDLTLDMAKHICMMSHTIKGKECRQNLIDLEKAWNSPEQIMARALKIAQRYIGDIRNTYFTPQQIKLLDPDTSTTKGRVLFTTTMIANDYGFTTPHFNMILNKIGVQTKTDKKWKLAPEYKNLGYIYGMNAEYYSWTQKGKAFLYDILKQNGILPINERG